MNKPSRATRWRRAFLEGRFQRVAGNGSFERPSPERHESDRRDEIDWRMGRSGCEGQGACRLIPARWAPSPPSCGFGSLERMRDRRPRAARQGSRLGRPSRPRPRGREIGSRRTNFDEVVVGRNQPDLKGPKAPCHQARRQRVHRPYWRQRRRDKTLPENTGQNSWEINGAGGRDGRGRNYPVLKRRI